MRIRSIKPGFYRSEDIDALTWDERLVFIGLWSYVDDNGVGLDKLSAICADLFSADLASEPQDTLRRVSAALERLHRGGLIVRYEATGKRLLFVRNWDSHQKVNHPADPRYTRPTSEDSEGQDSLFTSDRAALELVLPVVKEFGVKEVGSNTPSTRPRKAPDVDFEAFWAVYPRRQDKIAARKAFDKAIQTAPLEDLISGARRYAAEPGRKPEFTRLPATWLNAGSWANETTAPSSGERPSRILGGAHTGAKFLSGN